MTVQTVQSEPGMSQQTALQLSLQVFDKAGEEACHLPVTVKNLSTGGLVLEIPETADILADDELKGLQGFLLGGADHNGLSIKVPAKILWTRKHGEESVATLGLELLKPLPLSMRHALEDNLAIGSRDMKVLWDYWDEIREDASPKLAVELAPATLAAEKESAPEEPAPNTLAPLDDSAPAVKPQSTAPSSGAWLYLVGFGAIVIGMVLQYPQSEQLAFSGLVVMFLGSLVVAGKSLTSMWQVFSTHPSKEV